MVLTQSHPLLILGMHRSGTSMLASLLQARGVAIGDNLIGAAKGNPRGHFEDKDVYDFHLKALSRYRDHSWRLFDDGTLGIASFTYQPTEEETAEAKAIIDSRRRPGFWGWKEPRTCLFLDFWQSLLPDLMGIIIYRHPLEVHLSHLRRGANLDLCLRPAQAIHAYTLYNAKLLAAAKRQPERFLIINANAAFDQPALLNDRLSTFMGIAPAASASAQFHADEFRGLPLSSDLHACFAAAFPQAAAAFDELQQLASIKQQFSTAPASSALASLKSILFELPAAQRESCLPLLETLGAGSEAPLVGDWHQSLANAIVKKHTDHYEWAVSSIEKQDAYIRQLTETLRQTHEEKEKLGGAIQGEIEKTRQIWDELVKVGKDWHHKVEHIEGLTKQVESLKEEVRNLKAARTP